LEERIGIRVFLFMAVIVASLLLGFAGAWIMARYAYRLGLLDTPNDRSSHNLPTPRGGGVGILAALTVSALLLNLPITFWLPTVLLSLVSLFDDKLGLPPMTRLSFQFVAALIVSVPLAALFESRSPVLFPFLSFILIFFFCIFMVGTANFYNFMDGINGIAGITGVVAFGLIALFACIQANEPNFMLFAACIAAACLGFIPLNVPKARVFMGDVGSILLGFTFAALCIVLARSVLDFLVLGGFLSTFYADALTTLYIRQRDGQHLSQAHRRHLYQLLVNQTGIPHWQVSLGYGVIQAGIGGILIWIMQWGLYPVALCELMLFVFWWQAMKRVRLVTSDRICAN
jgi:Fuc2NAc and GlcNAc transferase